MSSTWLSYFLAWVAFVFVVNISTVNTKRHKNASIKKNVGDSKIVGGDWANIQDFPFIVSIQVFEPMYSGWKHHCGGSIITPHIVATACHCIVEKIPRPLKYRNPATLRVMAGTSTLSAKSANVQISGVQRLEMNSGCTADLWINDAGVIVLKDGFRFNGFVKPIGLYTRNPDQASARLRQMEQAHMQCFTPGWGSYDDKTSGPWLKFTPVTLLTSKQCDNLNCRYTRTCHFDYQGNNEVCAIDSSGMFCHGDSGGPLVCGGQLFGVVSYNYGCIVNRPMTYTDINPVLKVLNRYLWRDRKAHRSIQQKQPQNGQVQRQASHKWGKSQKPRFPSLPDKSLFTIGRMRVENENPLYNGSSIVPVNDVRI